MHNISVDIFKEFINNFIDTEDLFFFQQMIWSGKLEKYE